MSTADTRRLMTDTGYSGYQALAAAVLRTGFHAVNRPEIVKTPGVRKPNLNRIRAERIREWLFLFSERATVFAIGCDLDLPTLRAIAWEEGVVLSKHGDRTALAPDEARSRPFRMWEELHPFPPAGPSGGRLRVGKTVYTYLPWSESAIAQAQRFFTGKEEVGASGAVRSAGLA